MIALPYIISHEAADQKGKKVDRFSIYAHYVASGMFARGTCRVNIGLSDLDRDGKFNSDDSGRGTNLQIDLNADGKYWGRDEFHRTDEIIEICGGRFLVSALSNSRIEFTPTKLQLAYVGKPVPPFSFSLMNRSSHTAETLKGKPVVLDFWASWCVPCVANLSTLHRFRNEFGDRINIYSINVDKPTRRNLAENIIKQNQLEEISSIRGLGDADPLWKTFGGANLNRLSIPLYVLIDKDGTVRYVASGGDDLQELKQSIEKLPINN